MNKNQISHGWPISIQATEWGFIFVFSFSVQETNGVKKSKNQCHTEEKL